MDKIKLNIKRNILYYLIYLFFIVEMIINLKSNYIAGDESFTYNMIHHSFINIINLTAQDVHPFLYYFISKLFTYNIQNMYLQIYILRIVSALPYLILLIISNIYIKNKFSKFISIIFMFCVISMPLLIDNIYTIRMYGWAMLFTTLSYLLFISAYKKNNDIKCFMLITLFSLLSAYTHYYALITVSIVYFLFLILFIIKKRKLRYLILSVFINIIMYLPWLKVLLNQTKDVSNTFWTSKLTIANSIHIILGIISPVYKISLFYILPLLLLFTILASIINRHINIDGIIIIGMLTPIFLILFGIVLSIIVGHSVIMVRYVTPSMGIFWLAFSIFIYDVDVKYKILKFSLISLLILIGLSSYIITNKNTINFVNQFNKTVNVYNNIPKNSAIIYDDLEIMSTMSSYLSNNYLLDQSNNVYNKTLDNFQQRKSLNLPSKYKNIFYVKANKSNNNDFINQFNEKYVKDNAFTHHYKYIYLPIDYWGAINIYKIK